MVTCKKSSKCCNVLNALTTSGHNPSQPQLTEHMENPNSSKSLVQ